jgi:hypothetical protein
MAYGRSERSALIDALETTDPAAAASLKELRKYAPQAYRNAVRRLARTGIAPSPAPVVPAIVEPVEAPKKKAPKKKKADEG